MPADSFACLQGLLVLKVDEIASQYRAALFAQDNPLASLPIEETRAAIAPILSAVAGGRPVSDASASRIGQSRARQLRNPMHSLRAASTLYAVLTDVIGDGARELDAPREAEIRLLGLVHNAIMQQVTAAALPYSNILLRQIHSAQREERKRIARDLHDRAGYAVAIALQQIELRQIAIEQGEDGEAYLDVLGHSLREAASMIQEIAVELGRADTNEGLFKALEDFIAAHGRSRVVLEASGCEQVNAPDWIVEEAYLAIREGVRNALRHTDSSEVLVSVEVVPGELRARVVDSGEGFDPEGLPLTSSGKGMVSMVERIQLLGGDLTVTSAPGQGTTLTFAIPLPNA